MGQSNIRVGQPTELPEKSGQDKCSRPNLAEKPGRVMSRTVVGSGHPVYFCKLSCPGKAVRAQSRNSLYPALLK